MTYRELINAADVMLENSTITLGEYEEITKNRYWLRQGVVNVKVHSQRERIIAYIAVQR